MLMKKIRVFFTVMVLLAISFAAAAQNITVKGTVKDTAGEGIVGANIILKGNRTVYTMTDIDGSFSLNVPANGVLEVLCMGYQGQDVQVNNRTNIEVVLLDDSQLLDETIVVAYGTATKSSFTGSAAQVKAESIEKKIATNVTSALSGTTPGVQVISNSGDPTDNAGSIRIRGISSISGSTTPLIVVDGVPYDGNISDINPQDVESMSVLKDASASAIYGHRGANGVVLITTKKGQAGDGLVRFEGRVGVNSRLIPQYDVITNPAEYYEQWYTMMYNSYLYSDHTPAESHAYANKNLLDNNNGGLGYLVYTLPEGERLVGTNFKLNPNATLGYYDGEYYYLPDDWYNEVFHNSIRQEYNLSASGSTGKANYYASVGYLDDKGFVSNSGFKRYSARLNAEYQAKSWMRFNTSMSFTHTDSQMADYDAGTFGSSGSVFYASQSLAPIYPLYVRKLDENGNPYIVTDSGRIRYDSNNTNQTRPNLVGNAVRDNEYDYTQQYVDVVNGKFGTVLTPIKGLSLQANIGFTSYTSRYRSLSSQFAGSSGSDDYIYVSSGRQFSINKQFLAEYKLEFGKNNFDILAGYESFSRLVSSQSGHNTHLYNPYIPELNNADGTGDEVAANSSSTNYMTMGFLSRAQYDFDGRYFVSASYRRDASTRFADGHRWGNFGSIGGAWLINKEPWFNVPMVDLLKFKVSYGVQGNDNLNQGYFPYSDQYTHSATKNADGSWTYSIALAYVGNEDLTWETSRSFNTGFDFELFDRKLNGTVEFFTRQTADLLYMKNVPLSAGNPTGQVPVNVGTIMNRGIELSLDGAILRTKKIDWTWNFNISHYTNIIQSLDPSVSENGIRYSNAIYRVGGSVYNAYMRKWKGVDPEDGLAVYYAEVLADDNGNPILDDKGKMTYVKQPNADQKTTTVETKNFADASQYDLGSILPKAFGGFGTSLNAYGFDLSAQFQFQLGGRYYDGTYQQYMHTQNSQGQTWHKDILKAWQKPGDITDVPRNDGDTQVGQYAVDRFFISSDYLSVNNVTLGYTFPQKFAQKMRISNFRLYVTGENLAVFSARQGVDPRDNTGLGSMTSGSGLNNGRYGAMRNISGGVSITF